MYLIFHSYCCILVYNDGDKHIYHSVSLILIVLPSLPLSYIVIIYITDDCYMVLMSSLCCACFLLLIHSSFLATRTHTTTTEYTTGDNTDNGNE